MAAAGNEKAGVVLLQSDLLIILYSMEEALRQQAINRLQRRQNQAVADESFGDVEQAGTSSSVASENIPAAAVPAPEMELVFKPHPKQLATDNAIASETRYIKTTANATGTSKFCN